MFEGGGKKKGDEVGFDLLPFRTQAQCHTVFLPLE